ncbi:MAG: ABC transporter ATP-binding protein [Acidobacteriota bacterium]|nr:ABC transporter ATP-binding protein [Acidobacteriota bacterium]
MSFTPAFATSTRGGNPATDPTVEADRLAVALGGRLILHGIDLRVAPGELLAVIGPNGAGKSTLLRALAGVIRARDGEVRIEGRPVASYVRRSLARRLAYLPQETWTEFGITVEEVVRLGRYPHVGMFKPHRDEDRRAIALAMERADIRHLARRRLTTLSGGERRRVFLARAVAQGAGTLVLDEPTSALDVGHACAVLDFLRRFADEGAAVVFSLHDLSLVLRGPGRCVLLDEGRIAAEGPPADVVTSEAATRAFGVPLAVVGDPPAVIPARR